MRENLSQKLLSTEDIAFRLQRIHLAPCLLRSFSYFAFESPEHQMGQQQRIDPQLALHSLQGQIRSEFGGCFRKSSSAASALRCASAGVIGGR